jgi:hypothetical protein
MSYCNNNVESDNDVTQRYYRVQLTHKVVTIVTIVVNKLRQCCWFQLQILVLIVRKLQSQYYRFPLLALSTSKFRKQNSIEYFAGRNNSELC